jgi:DNA polymerase eta
VKDKKAVVKSMLASKNLPKPITNASEGFHWIRVLAAELALRLNDARKTTPNLWPKTLVLSARKGILLYLVLHVILTITGYETGRSKQAPFPFTREVTVDIIASAGDKLWKELVGTNVAMKVTCIHLGFTGLESSEIGQRTIEGFLKTGETSKRPREKDDDATDDKLVSYVNLIGDNNPMIDPTLSFTCTRCGDSIQLTVPLSGVGAEEALTALRQEHDDFHFAQELAKEQQPNNLVISGPKTGPKMSPKKKRRKDPPSRGSIEQFFGRKAS